jgi:molecular chaperone DnaJ
VIPEPCPTCAGAGRIKRNKTLEVNIPAGIDDGMRIRSGGNGEPGVNGGPSGDLYVEIHIKQHDVFHREGDDLSCEMPISFAKAALGGEIEAPTLNGKAAFSIPEGTQSGKTFRLRGKGVKNVHSKVPGDLFCRVVVETPVKLTERQKDLMREFEQLTTEGGAKHSPQTKTWKDKVKEFFE